MHNKTAVLGIISTALTCASRKDNMKIYYIYAYINNQLLYITEDEKKWDDMMEYYEREGVEVWGVDTQAMINNLKIDQEMWKEAQHD